MLEIVAGVGDDVSVSGGRTRQRPSASLAPPTPPDSATTGRDASSEQIVLRADGPGRRPAHRGAVQARPRTSATGTASSAWPMTSEAAAAISSAKPVCGDLELSAEQIGMAAPVDQRRQARGAERDADRAATPRPAEAVADDDARYACRCAPQSCAAALRRWRRGSSGSSSTRSRAVVRRDIGLVDAGIGHDEAEAMLGDHQAGPVAHDAARIRARITSTRRGSFSTFAASAIACGDGSTAATRRCGPRPWRRSSAPRPARRRLRRQGRRVGGQPMPRGLAICTIDTRARYRDQRSSPCHHTSMPGLRAPAPVICSWMPSSPAMRSRVACISRTANRTPCAGAA